MHTIKFRGKILNETGKGEWVYGYYYAMPGHMSMTQKKEHNIVTNKGVFYKVDPKTVSQYVGEEDKSGIGIYEGDFVEEFRISTYYPDGNLTTKQIIWDDEMTLDDMFGERAVGFNLGGGTLKVIGNIHDNPNLLLNNMHLQNVQDQYYKATGLIPKM